MSGYDVAKRVHAMLMPEDADAFDAQWEALPAAQRDAWMDLASDLNDAARDSLEMTVRDEIVANEAAKRRRGIF